MAHSSPTDRHGGRGGEVFDRSLVKSLTHSFAEVIRTTLETLTPSTAF